MKECSWREATYSRNYLSMESRPFKLGDFADQLINIFDRSHHCFLYLLESSFQHARSLSDADLTAMMEYVQSTIGTKKIEQYLTNLGDESRLSLSELTHLSDAAKDICKNHSICLDIYITRHRYGDFSETEIDTVNQSILSLKEKSGHYVSTYKYKNFKLIITTNLTKNTTGIDVFIL
ncbi:hypothetical protein [Yersinia ruckeri]|uniref:hypothetical protein n=1 Tax=Yersinia ruckeri TaxID=29486 RepID=UPI0013158E70|nr:hypothetical protein [Yersinia ruckeri]